MGSGVWDGTFGWFGAGRRRVLFGSSDGSLGPGLPDLLERESSVEIGRLAGLNHRQVVLGAQVRHEVVYVLVEFLGLVGGYVVWGASGLVLGTDEEAPALVGKISQVEIALDH